MAASDLHHELHARGYRLTPQRQLVLEAVRRLRHATPEDIASEVRRTAAGVNITTVYRTLELLEELGLITHAHLDHRAPAYHVADNEHLHVVCRMCHTVSDVPADIVTDVVRRMNTERGFTVDVGHITLFGTCSACAEGESGPDSRPDPVSRPEN